MKVYLGIELGSTRIKAVAIDKKGKPLAAGGYDWENRFENGMWTYRMDDVWTGLRESYKELVNDYSKKHGSAPEIAAIGISAMMHGYLPLGKDGQQLVDFRTWRNTITEESSKLLIETFNFNIPQRWSIAHLHRAVKGKEAHVSEISFLATLPSYIHYKLTGKKVVGIGEASGMFPIDSTTNEYDKIMVEKFDNLIAEYNLPWKLKDILPEILVAGENAGYLTEAGAKLLDPTETLKAGIPLCPPEGDAGTGMIATNAIKPATGNISAGTSIFAMLVLEKALSKLYVDIDMITTPAGKPVAMVHCNNCTSDLDAWVALFGDVMTKMSAPPDKTELYRTLYNAALRGDPDCGGLVAVSYLSGEHTTGFHEGRPLFARTPDSKFSVENFMRSLLLSSMATLKIGMNILTNEEGVKANKWLGHGGLFKTPIVGQKLMAGVLETPVAVMESAGEGGAWGIALLAAYSESKEFGESLEDFLDNKIFADAALSTITPDPSDAEGFNKYLETYKAALKIERTAVDNL
ncbi:MAG: FGGY-family carbohydrate kinase [Oscillospiraceae bacterium]|nr:FGGY-family carbohydrate kinase [Oscillospiraceae bacterium]MCL2278497.1 FGGY-family carbohydrate kinase [Oscillospiraceae bacterium]